jgi:hypothetical protein
MTCSSTTTPLWIHDVSILWKDAGDFFPLKQKTDGNSRLNAIVRFILYSAVLLAGYKKNPLPLLYGAGLILVATFLHVRATGNAFQKARRVRTRSCRLPTAMNPYMNTPTVEMSSGKEPCYDKMGDSDTLANINTVRDVDDILSPVENRAFFTLPGGGGPPDFSKLSQTLGREMAADDCGSVGRW